MTKFISKDMRHVALLNSIKKGTNMPFEVRYLFYDMDEQEQPEIFKHEDFDDSFKEIVKMY